MPVDPFDVEYEDRVSWDEPPVDETFYDPYSGCDVFEVDYWSWQDDYLDD